MVIRPIPKAPTPTVASTPPPSPKWIDPTTLRVPGKPPPTPEKERKSEAKANRDNPFKRHSLLGHSAELEAQATKIEPLLGSFIMSGQASMIYAEPGTGKTLTGLKLALDAVYNGLVVADNVLFINADDNSMGLMTKNAILENAGIHMLAPGYNGMTIAKVAELLAEVVQNNQSKGLVIFIDTLKKFADLMDKKRTSEFAQLCRAFVAQGGTIIAFGHTAKNPNADGSPRYQGTTDVLEDFDAVYVGEALSPKNTERKIKGVRFTRKKSRGDSPETVCYAFSTETGISYEEKLASVTFIDGDDIEDYVLDKENVSEAPVLDAIIQIIKEGSIKGKMAVSKAASKRANVSHKAAMSILEYYTGTTPRQHIWTFHKGERGVQIYTLIDQ